MSKIISLDEDENEDEDDKRSIIIVEYMKVMLSFINAYYFKYNKDKNKLKELIEWTTNNIIENGDEDVIKHLFLSAQVMGDIPIDLKYSPENFVNGFLNAVIKRSREFDDAFKKLGFVPENLEYSPENLKKTLEYIVKNNIKVDWKVEKDENGRHYTIKDGKRIYFD